MRGQNQSAWGGWYNRGKGGVEMEEKQNKEKVTLDNILDEIRLMRKEARIQHKEVTYFNGFSIASAVVILGATLYTMTLGLCWQRINGFGIMVLGACFAVYCLSKKITLGKEQRETHKETENSHSEEKLDEIKELLERFQRRAENQWIYIIGLTCVMGALALQAIKSPSWAVLLTFLGGFTIMMLSHFRG